MDSAIHDLLALIGEAASAYRLFATPSSDPGAALLAYDVAKGRLASKIKTDFASNLGQNEYILPGGESFQVGPELWASWASQRGSEVGAAQVLADMKRYLESKEIPCQRVFGIKGITLEARLELAQGISLVPLSSIENPFETRPPVIGMGHGPYNIPNSALVVKRMASRSRGGLPEVDQAADDDLWDAALCLTLVGPSAPTPMAAWYILPPWVPRWGVGSLSWGVPPVLPTFKLEEREYADAQAIHAAFVACHKQLKRRLRIPLARLRSAIREINPVDAAIDLGIAVEAIFIPGEYQELTYKLSLRAGWYLGQDSESRLAVAELFRDLYHLRSIAVHTGNLRTKSTQPNAWGLLRSGFEKTAQALRHAIFDGDLPDWNTLVFG